jgi:hypothetical protein
MPGKVIGKKLNFGFVGQISRQEDAIVVARTTDGEVKFGQAVVLTEDNKIKAFGSSNVDADFVGFALREVKQATIYATGESKYESNEVADVLSRGTLTVKLASGTPAPGGKVYIRTVADTGKEIGDIESESDTGKNVALTNAIFTTGKVDANGVVEVTILNRRM